MRIKNVLTLQEKQIRDWRLIAVALLLVNIFLGVSLKNTVNDITVHIPPRIERGTTMKAGDVPAPNVYSFSYYLFQKLSTWEKDGSKEGLKSIYDFRFYLTDDFKSDLELIHTTRTQSGETKGRTRTVQEADKKGFNSSLVYKVSEGKWVVKLDMRIIEKIGDTVIKDVAVRYPIVVILEDTHPDDNSWGLKFAGFDSEPRKILLKSNK